MKLALLLLIIVFSGLLQTVNGKVLQSPDELLSQVQRIYGGLSSYSDTVMGQQEIKDGGRTTSVRYFQSRTDFLRSAAKFRFEVKSRHISVTQGTVVLFHNGQTLTYRQGPRGNVEGTEETLEHGLIAAMSPSQSYSVNIGKLLYPNHSARSILTLERAALGAEETLEGSRVRIIVGKWNGSELKLFFDAKTLFLLQIEKQDTSTSLGGFETFTRIRINPRVPETIPEHIFRLEPLGFPGVM